MNINIITQTRKGETEQQATKRNRKALKLVEKFLKKHPLPIPVESISIVMSNVVSVEV